MGRDDAAGLDRLMHEPARLAIASLLASRRDMTFTELRDALEMTDGNLSAHLRALEQAEYVAVEKAFVARRPLTTIRLSRRGRAALNEYLDRLEAVLRKAGRIGAPPQGS